MPSIEGQSHFSIRNREHWQALPSLEIIREAIVAFYDFLETESRDLYLTRLYKEIDQFFPQMYVPLYLIEEYFHNLTRKKCDVASFFVGRYLEIHYPGRFDAFLINTGHELNYFQRHYVLALCSPLDKKWLAVSPANIFNPRPQKTVYMSDEHYIPGETPKYNGQPFVRSTDVLAADSYQGLIAELEKLEGGHWPAEDELPWRGLNTYFLKNYYENPDERVTTFLEAISRKASP